MAKVDTNVVRLQYARETTAGTIATAGWRSLEPNEISQYGATITTTPREPISDRLQRRKGAVTDLDSETAFSADITVDGLWDWIEAAVFATSQNADVRDLIPTAVGAGGTYTIPTGVLPAASYGKLPHETAAQVVTSISADINATVTTVAVADASLISSGDTIQVNAEEMSVTGVTGNSLTVTRGANGTTAASHSANALVSVLAFPHIAGLLWALAFSTSGNDGLKVQSAAPSGGTVAVEGTLDAETTPTGRLSLAGCRITGGNTTWAWDTTAGRATLTKDGIGTSLNNLGLYYGQLVHIGSVATRNGALQQGVGATAAARNYGFARYISSTANTLVFDRVDSALQVSAAVSVPPSLSFDICYGDFLYNVSRSDDAYLQRSHTIEQVSPGLGDGGSNPTSDGYEYATGQVVSTLALNFPLTDKATMTVNFAGQDTTSPTITRATGASDAVDPFRTEAFNTSSDFARLIMRDVDDDGITTDFKSMTITINPQTSPEKVIGVLGARYINRGNMLVDTEAQVVFTDPGVLEAIHQNQTTRFETVIGNNDGVFHFEVPSQTVTGGGREYPTNQAVLLNSTGQSFEDEDFGTSIHISFLPTPIPIG